MESTGDSFDGFHTSTGLHYKSIQEHGIARLVPDLDSSESGEELLEIALNRSIEHSATQEETLDRSIEEASSVKQEIKEAIVIIERLDPSGITEEELILLENPKAANMSETITDEEAKAMIESLDHDIQSAEMQISSTKEMLADSETLTPTLVGRLARLKSMKQNMIDLGNKLSNYEGSVSTSPTMAQVTETGFDMDDLMATIEWDIKEKTPAKEPDKNNSISIVKTVSSLFPKFDGDKVNFDIWKKQWKALADNSGLKNNGLLIKLRESMEGVAKDYIGEYGMIDLDYVQFWNKLE